MPVPQEIIVKIQTDSEVYAAGDIQFLLRLAAPQEKFVVEEVEDE